MSNHIVVTDITEYYDYTTPMMDTNDELQFIRDMEDIRYLMKLKEKKKKNNISNPTGKPINTMAAFTNRALTADFSTTALTAATAAASAGGKTKKKKNKKTKKGGKRKEKKSKSRKKYNKKKSRKNNIKRINRENKILKILRKFEQKAGAAADATANRKPSIGGLRSKTAAVFNKITKVLFEKNKLSTVAADLETKIARDQNETKQQLSNIVLPLDLKDFMKISEDKRRCLFGIKLGGNVGDVMLKIAPVYQGIKGVIELKPADECNKFNYKETGSYYYEAEIYNEVNKVAAGTPSISDSVIKFYGLTYKDVTLIKSDDFKFTIKREVRETITLPKDKIIKALNRLWFLSNKKIIGFTFLFTEKNNNFTQTVGDYIESKGVNKTKIEKDLKENIFNILEVLYKKIGFVHYDLHGKNCLINPITGDLKLFDFDLSQITLTADNKPCPPEKAIKNSKSILYTEGKTYYDEIGKLYTAGTQQDKDKDKEKAIRLAGVLWDAYRVYNHWGFNDSLELYTLEDFFNKFAYYASHATNQNDEDTRFKKELINKDIYKNIEKVCGNDFGYLIQFMVKLRKQTSLVIDALDPSQKLRYWGLLKYNITRAMPLPKEMTLGGIKIITTPQATQQGSPQTSFSDDLDFINQLVEELDKMNVPAGAAGAAGQAKSVKIPEKSGITVTYDNTTYSGSEEITLPRSEKITLPRSVENHVKQFNIQHPQGALDALKLKSGPLNLPTYDEDYKAFETLLKFEIVQSAP